MPLWIAGLTKQLFLRTVGSALPVFLEKVNKLRRDLYDLENDLENKLKGQLKQVKESGQLMFKDAELEDTSLASTPTSSRKRVSSVTPTDSRSEKRRALAFGKSTPVRAAT